MNAATAANVKERLAGATIWEQLAQTGNCVANVSLCNGARVALPVVAKSEMSLKVFEVHARLCG